MRIWMTGLALLCAILVQGCATPPPGSANTAPAGKSTPMPDFGSKAYGY